MKERPISFNGEMVRAILDGRKTQTRRIVPERILDKYLDKYYDYDDYCNSVMASGVQCKRDFEKGYFLDLCPFGQVGDRLWVRETFKYAPQRFCYCPQGSSPVPCDDWANGNGCASHSDEVIYRADNSRLMKWVPPIHMPKWASRITLEITDVRVQLLQDISEEDAIAEGFGNMPKGIIIPFTEPIQRLEIKAKDYFEEIWNSIYYKKGFGWENNPWVWAITFKRVK